MIVMATDISNSAGSEIDLIFQNGLVRFLEK